MQRKFWTHKRLTYLATLLGTVAILAVFIGIPAAMWWDAQRFAVYEEQGLVVVRMPVEGTLNVPMLGTCTRCTLTYIIYDRDVANPAKQRLAMKSTLPFVKWRATQVILYHMDNGRSAAVWGGYYRLGHDGLKHHDLTGSEKHMLSAMVFRAVEESERYLAQKDILTRQPNKT